MKDGRYKVSLVPKAEGSYSLSLAICSEEKTEEINGAPFPIMVLPPRDYLSIGAEASGGGSKSKTWKADIRRPSGMCFDRTGRFVFVVDQSDERLQIFDAERKVAIAAFGQRGYGAQDFNTPGFVAASSENLVVVSDILNHRLHVFRFNPSAVSLWHVGTVGGPGTSSRQFQFPRGVAINDQEQVFVCDSGNNRLQVLDARDNFKFVRAFGERGFGDGQFDMPLDVAINRDGQVLVADASHRIQVFDRDGCWLRSFGEKGKKSGMFRYPCSLAVDNENQVFVCDQGNRRVQVLDASSGTFLHQWGGRRVKHDEDDAQGEPSPAKSKPLPHTKDKAAEEVKPDAKKKADPKAKADPKKRPTKADTGPGPAAQSLPPGRGAPSPAFSENEWVGLVSPAGIAVNSHGMILVGDSLRNVLFEY